MVSSKDSSLVRAEPFDDDELFVLHHVSAVPLFGVENRSTDVDGSFKVPVLVREGGAEF